ncbi:MAG: DUF1501 domain-containing protein [Chloroflexota bacterium]
MTVTRRDFIRNGALLVAMGIAAPTFVTQSIAEAKDALQRQIGKHTLVLVQLSGGNDGLNTVIPYADALYMQLRPQVGIPASNVIRLNAGIGLHPSLQPLKPIYDAGNLAVIQGVGYPNPNRSHFRSMEIWHTATPDRFERSGWLGRYLDGCDCGDENPLHAINNGDLLNRSFWTEMSLVPAIGSLATFQYQTDPRFARDRSAQLQALSNIYAMAGNWRPYEELIRQTTLRAIAGADVLKSIASTYDTPIEYPASPFSANLKNVAQILAADLGTRIFFTSLGGFDTHAGQANTHGTLLGTLSQGLSAFYRDLERIGRADDVVIMTFSEFGRRAQQNGSAGTDHGTAEPVFVLGGGVKGGIYGPNPDLSDLDEIGDLKFHTDFRSVYATVLERWLGSSSESVLGGRFHLMPFLG